MSRRKSRQVILQMLYRDEFHSDFIEKNKTFDFFLENKNLGEADSEFVLEVLQGIQKNKANIDEIIRKYSKNWKQERISLVDLNIMRMAIFEILFYPKVPDKVALDEALRLAKTFGGKKSVSFTNGILDQVLKNKKTIL